LDRFCLLQAAQEQNKTFIFLTNDIKTKTKGFQLRQGFLKTKQNFWLSQKKKLEMDQIKSLWTKIVYY